MAELYAIIWRSSAGVEEFESRIPGLMEWLRDLKAEGRLKACGGWLHDEGGLTIIEAESLDEAIAIQQRNPLEKIGTSEIHAWDLFFADLNRTANL